MIKFLKLALKVGVANKNFLLVKLGLASKKRRVSEARMSICRDCKIFDKQRDVCTFCGCYMRKKTLLLEEECPKGKWKKEE